MEDSINKIVECAIKLSDVEINLNDRLILSESDFERLLVNKIQSLLTYESEKYEIHTQVSFYKDGDSTYISENELEQVNANQSQKRKYQIDIVVLKQAYINPVGGIRKGFKYSEPACVIEVKYLHDTDGGKASLIKKDIEKGPTLCKGKKGSYLWCVTLIDSRNTQEHEQVKEVYKQHLNELEDDDKNKLKCVLLYKYGNQIDWIHEE